MLLFLFISILIAIPRAFLLGREVSRSMHNVFTDEKTSSYHGFGFCLPHPIVLHSLHGACRNCYHRSRLSEVIKTKLVLQNEVAAARQRENQLREDLRLKMEAKETSQFPRSCLQFDMTAEDGSRKRWGDSYPSDD